MKKLTVCKLIVFSAKIVKDNKLDTALQVFVNKVNNVTLTPIQVYKQLTFSLKTDIISKKSSKVSSPSLDDENTLQILSLKGFT